MHISFQKVPKYILLDLDQDKQRKCNQMHEEIVPHNVQANMTDKDLVRSLFNNRVNLAYVINSDANLETIPMQGNLCKNASYEWLLLTIIDHSLFINDANLKYF